MYLPWHAIALSSTGHVHCVAKETVSRHPTTHDPRHNLSTVNTNTHLELRKEGKGGKEGEQGRGREGKEGGREREREEKGGRGREGDVITRSLLAVTSIGM